MGAALTVRVCAALIAGTTMGSVGGTVMPVLLDGFGRRFHFSHLASGLVAATQLLATAVVALSLSRRAGLPGRVRMARWGLAAAGIGFCGAAMAQSTVVLVLANVLAGAGMGAAFAAAAASLASVDDKERASTVAVFGGTAVTVVLLVGIPEANTLWGGTAGFAIMAAACVPAWWLVRALPEAGPGGPHPTHPLGASSPWWFLAAIGLLAVTDQGAWSYVSVLGEDRAGLSSGAISVVLATAGLAALAGVIGTALVASRLGRFATLFLLLAAEAAAKLLVAASSDGLVYATATVLWQVCYLGLLAQMWRW